MQIKEITKTLERWAPLPLQESYDNCGLLVGNEDADCTGAVITLDITEAVIDEAIANHANLIIAHHPLIFKGIKKIGNTHWLDRCLVKAIKHDIALYAIHTNLDNVKTGVNSKICQRLGLDDFRILAPKKGRLQKLVTFIPVSETDQVLDALYQAGAGNIGAYDQCSFRVTGTGTFRPGNEANPTIGARNQPETVEENRVELIFPDYLKSTVLSSLNSAHSYEEVAYYLHALENVNQEIGSGMIGHLTSPMKARVFLDHVKEAMELQVIKHTKLITDNIQKIAVCGGSGSFLLNQAISQGADILLTSDFKYHDYFEANDQIIIVDIGHFESEVYTKDLIYDYLTKKFANIALHLSKVNTNPVHYY